MEVRYGETQLIVILEGVFPWAMCIWVTADGNDGVDFSNLDSDDVASAAVNIYGSINIHRIMNLMTPMLDTKIVMKFVIVEFNSQLSVVTEQFW